MPRYLIDANLPRFSSQWNSPEYMHQHDIDPERQDQVIWQFAKEHDLTFARATWICAASMQP